MATIRFRSCRVEEDLDGSFLANKKSSSLGSAEIRSRTDFHVSGGAYTEHALVTTKSTQFELQLSPDDFEVFVTKKNGRSASTISINDRTRLNATTSRIGMAIDGSVVDVLAGQGSSLLKDIFSDQVDASSHSMPMQYASWLAYSSILTISNAEIIDNSTGKPFATATFKSNPERDTRSEAALKLVEAKYLTGVQRRNVIVFKDVPELSKSVMRVPVGIHASGYDLSCNVVDRPQALTDKAFESLLSATLKNVLLGNIAEFMTVCGTGITIEGSERFSDKVCSTMSCVAAALTPYRVDGISALMPTGLQMVTSESWKAEAPRSVTSADDCDGSAALICSALYRADVIAGDASLAKQFPVTTAVSNALGHHVVGVCVLAANAGHADAADTKAVSLAGHAIALVVPRTFMLNGLTSTALHSRSIVVPDDDIQAHMNVVADVKDAWASSLYPEDVLNRMPNEDEKKKFSTAEGVTNNTPLTTLAIEGTSPVAPSILHEPNLEKRWVDEQLQTADRRLSEKVGPTVARKLSSLHVSESGKHQFYHSLVEFLLPLRRSPLFTSKQMRDQNFCTSHFVFTDAHDPLAAGASPQQLSTGDFGLAPLYSCTQDESDELLEASNEVLRNTLPMRSGPERLSKARSASYAANISRLNEMHVKLNRPNESQSTLDYIVPFAALIDNQKAISVLCEHIESVCSSKSSSAAVVEMQHVTGILEDFDGSDVGKLVMITISMAA